MQHHNIKKMRWDDLINRPVIRCECGQTFFSQQEWQYHKQRAEILQLPAYLW